MSILHKDILTSQAYLRSHSWSTYIYLLNYLLVCNSHMFMLYCTSMWIFVKTAIGPVCTYLKNKADSDLT